MKKHILFVDDEKSVLEALQRMLFPHVDLWEMTFLDQPEEAWQRLLTEDFDAIVLDIKMPGISGFELLDKIQENERTRKIPVVLLTGVQDISLKRQALERGAADLLNKPIVSEDLLARINNILRLKACQDSLEQQYQELQKQSRLLNTVLDGISDVINVQKPDHAIQYINKAGKKFYGLQSEEILGLKCYKLLGRQAPCDECASEVALKSKQVTSLERFLPDHNIWIEARSIPVLDAHGNVSLIVEQLRDISARKRAEENLLQDQEKLRQSEERIRLLMDSTAEAIFGMDVNGICTFCNPSCVRLLGYEHPHEIIGKNMHSLTHPNSPDGTPTPQEEGPTFSAIKTGHNMHWDDIVLWRADGTSFHAEYWNHLQWVGDRIVGITGIFFDITERRKMGEALRVSEEWHRRVSENMSDVIWAIDFTGRVIYISPSIMQMIGFTPEEATQLTFEQMVTPFSLGLARKNFEKALAMARVNQRIEIDCFELEFFCKDGSTAWGELSVSGMYDTLGNVIGFQGMTRDITKRKQMEEALRESEQRHRLFAENVRDMLWIVDYTGKFTYASPSVMQIFGYTPEEAMQLTIEQLVTPSWIGPAHKKFEECIAMANQRMEIDCFEMECFRKNGSIIWVEISISGMYDSSGNVIGFQGTTRDTTKRKQMEEALCESEERHRLFAENVSDVLWTMDITGKFTYMSPSIVRFLGFTPEETVQVTYRDITTPSSLDMANMKFEERLAKAEANQQNESDIFELEFFHKDGSTVWGESIISGIFESSGRIIGVQGVTRDITKRRQAQEDLRQSEKRWWTIFESSRDALVLLNEKGYIYCNAHAVELYGFKTKEELIGLCPDKLSPPFQPNGEPSSSEARRHIETAYEKGVCKFEWLYYRSNGEEFLAEVLLSPFEYNGETVLQSNMRDITERKRAEEALHQSQERWRAIFEHSKVPMMLVEPGAGLVDINSQTLELLGYESKEELIGLSPCALAPPFQPNGEPSMDAQKRHDQIALEQGVHSFEWMDRRKNGEDILVDIVLSKINYGGRVVLLATKRDITERKKIEEALRESEERYRILFESSRDALTTLGPPAWRFASGNSAAIELFKASNLEEFVSRGPWDLSPKYQPDGRLSAEKAKEMIEKALQQGENLFEWTHKRFNGEEFPATVLLTRCEVKGRVIIQATARDITAIKQTEAELREQTQLLSTVIDGIPDVITLLKPDQTILRCNKAGYTFHGLPSGKVHGRKCYEVLGRDAPCEICATKIALESKQISLVEKFLPERNIWIEDRSIPVLDERGKVYLVVEEMRDISDRKRMEQEQARYNATLEVNNSALAEFSQMAESATRAKSEFLANMSHEIRTPMTVILGYSQYLLNEEGLEKAPPHRREAFRNIERNGQHLLTIINDILDLSKIEAGKLDAEKIMCSPMSILADVASMMRVHAINKKLSLRLEYASPIPDAINTDPTRLKQILVNLVFNAIKFTDTGEVKIKVRMLEADDAKPKLGFDIIDTGIGIEPGQIKLLFQYFSQADASTSRKYGGTGLGLAISKRLAKLLGGDITVSSIPGTGSTFTLTVSTGPLTGIEMINNPSEALCQNVEKFEPSQRDAFRLNCRILLAEDTPDIQCLITMLLADAGADVTPVDNGQLAVEAAWSAHREGKTFDIILMDMQMPIMDGYEATGKLRSEGYEGRIIAMTAHSMQGDREKCLQSGCDGYLSKPVDPDRLMEVVEESITANKVEKDSSHVEDVSGPPSESIDVLYSQYADRPIIARLLGEFVGRLDGRVRAMQEALGASRSEDLRHLAHQLKGAAGSYGYPLLFAAAKTLEEDARLERLESAAKDLEHIVALCRAVVRGREVSPDPV